MNRNAQDKSLENILKTFEKQILHKNFQHSKSRRMIKEEVIEYIITNIVQHLLFHFN